METVTDSSAYETGFRIGQAEVQRGEKVARRRLDSLFRLQALECKSEDLLNDKWKNEERRGMIAGIRKGLSSIEQP